jgi:hypothetical protein
MITASLHRSPTGPARRSARRLCVEELTTALRLGQLGLVRPPLAVTASSARRYGAFMATVA